MNEERFNKKFSKKAILILVVVVVSSLGVSTAVFGIRDIISTNSYNILTEDYEKLSGDYNVLLTNYSGILVSYYDVNEKYQNLTEDYNDLNETYYILTGDYIDLQGDYDSLVINYAKLIIDYDNLEDQFDILQQEYDEIQENHTNLQDQYNILLNNYQTLNESYNNLWNSHQLLIEIHGDLLDMYNDLSIQNQILQGKYNTLKTHISTLILPAQYLVFAEAVRRYYMPLYLEGKYDTEHRESSVEFSRDVMLHDSTQENSFGEISNIFSECLKFGNNTMYLAFYIMYCTFWDWLPNWGGWGLSGNELVDINIIHQWCVDVIDYEYDSGITYGQEDISWDYIKFSVETAFRTMGDCDDQAILDATYLESCGFETAIILIRDPDYPGGLYHYGLFVHINDTDAFHAMYSCPLWDFGDIDPYENFTWCCLDPTWDVPFGGIPGWLQYYAGGFPTDICSIAICDPDGSVGQPDLQWSI